MPEAIKVSKCVEAVMKTGRTKPEAIKICQTSTKTSHATGKPPKEVKANKHLKFKDS
jgi:hypothetical protein